MHCSKNVGGANLSCDYNSSLSNSAIPSNVVGAFFECDKTVSSVSFEQEVFPQNSNSCSILNLGVLFLSVTTTSSIFTSRPCKMSEVLFCNTHLQVFTLAFSLCPFPFSLEIFSSCGNYLNSYNHLNQKFINHKIYKTYENNSN